ncbi:hypothetical protein [Agrobacterium tumefaciens]|uniref:hypothetical protein n=1 Tax=Agrobacterium tumefaciens TaxID=358 RepID=UPI0007C83DE7|nr:hypothetical protein [Agrobacterium tumefaciens]
MKTLFQTMAVLAALIVPANAFEPIPFGLTFPTQSRSKVSAIPGGEVSRLKRSNSNAPSDNSKKSGQTKIPARHEKHSR